MELAAAMAERVKKGTIRAPPSPLVAMRLMQLLGDDRSTLTAIKSTLEKDQMLAAIVLRLANSARYRWGREVTSVQQAIVVLGRRALREVSLARELHDRSFAAGPLLSLRRRAWRESLTAAHVASWVSEHFKVVPDVAFAAALLQDIGRVPAIGVLEDVLPDGKARPADEELWALVNRHHVELGSLLARTWGLPSELTDVICSHHAPEVTSPLLETVRVAEEVVRLMDGAPHLASQKLGVIAALDTATCSSLAAKLALMPTQLDAFREDQTSTAVESYELHVNDDEAAAQRKVVVTSEGVTLEAQVQKASESELTLSVPLHVQRVVRVNAGEASFHARVTAVAGDSSQLRPWALDEKQLAAWKGFVDSGLEDLYRLAAS